MKWASTLFATCNCQNNCSNIDTLPLVYFVCHSILENKTDLDVCHVLLGQKQLWDKTVHLISLCLSSFEFECASFPHGVYGYKWPKLFCQNVLVTGNTKTG